MSDVIRLPSIWDYLGQAGTEGVTSFQEARERLRRQQMEQVGLMTNLFGAGAIDNTDLMPALDKVGIKANIQPNQPQRQRDILKSPDINPATGKPWTYAEKKIAGVPSTTEELKDTNEASAETVRAKFLKGEPLTDREAKFAGVPTDEELTLGKLQAQNKVLSEVGPQYVDMALAKYGGRVPADWNKVVDQAFAAYVADRQRSGLPADPSHRAFFVSQIFERQHDQRQLDIAQQNANANAAQAGRGVQDRQLAAINQLVESRRKALDDVSSDPMVALKIGNPKYATDPQVVEYKNRLAAYNKAVNAQIQYSGLDPKVAAELRKEAQDTRPTERPILTPEIHKKIADRILKKQGTLEQMAADVRAGKVSYTDYNAVRELVAQTQRKN